MRTRRRHRRRRRRHRRSVSQRRHGFLDDDRSRPRLLLAPAFPSQACRRVRSRITKLALARARYVGHAVLSRRVRLRANYVIPAR